MKKLLPVLLLASMALSYTVKVVLYGDTVTAYVNGYPFELIRGVNEIEVEGKSEIRFSAYYGLGWVTPRLVTVDSTRTVYVVSSLKSAEVEVKSNPPGAEVLFSYNGSPPIKLGRTPLRGELPVGVVELTLRKVGYNDLKASVEVPVDGVSLSYDLVPRNMITFKTDPRSTVLIDGSPAGETPFSTVLSPGTHLIEFEMDGVIVESTILNVQDSGDVLELFFELPGVYNLKVDTDPSPAFVAVDGRIFRSPVELKIVEGRHRLECWADGYPKVEEDVDVSEDVDELCRLVDRKWRVRVKGGYSLVIDGKAMGDEALVREGFHLVEVVGGKGKWLYFEYIDSNVLIDPDPKTGTLIALVREFFLGSERFIGPGVFRIPAGEYTISVPKRGFSRIRIKSGEVVVYPGDYGALFLLSDPSPMKVAVAGKILSTPEILGATGSIPVDVLEGCRITRRDVEVEKGSYHVEIVKPGCGGADR